MANIAQPISIICCILAVLSTPANASHTSESYPDVILDGTAPLEMLVLDAIPSGPEYDSNPRMVHLAFDLELLSSLEFAVPLRIVANGISILDTTFSGYGTQAYPGTVGIDSYPAGTGSLASSSGLQYELDLTFPLFAEVGCCTDISVRMDQPAPTSGTALALSNITLDWSRPIPEPNAAALLAMGLSGLALSRHRITSGWCRMNPR